jgi:hypothetical protein
MVVKELCSESPFPIFIEFGTINYLAIFQAEPKLACIFTYNYFSNLTFNFQMNIWHNLIL